MQIGLMKNRLWIKMERKRVQIPFRNEIIIESLPVY
jgi:hypothetical protein